MADDAAESGATDSLASPRDTSSSKERAARPKAGRRSLGAAARGWLRALHRDAGYLAVGLTFVYALSGLAVNHLSQWDPNFRRVERTHALGGPLTGDDEAIARTVAARLGITARLRDYYRTGDAQLEVTFDRRTLHVDTARGTVRDEGEQPRFLLRAANWLHLNRGKKAWTYIADGYAVALLFLATSGLFMIPGRKGFFGRGALIALAGAMIPVLYVHYAGP